MWSIFNLDYWWGEEKICIPDAPPLILPQQKLPKKIKHISISLKDIKSVKLRSDRHNMPGPARNMPAMSKFYMGMLTKDHLNDILNVKLKKIKVPERQKVFSPRHPVLRQIESRRMGPGKAYMGKACPLHTF